MALTMSGEVQIPAPREKVYAALNNPDILRQCVPGCESLEKLSDTEFQAVSVMKIGPVKAKWGGKVTLSDLDPPNGYKISGEGQGGVAGFAKGQAEVKLVPEGEATRLEYVAKATIGGKLAQVGSRLVDGVAKKLAEQFFTAFNNHLSKPE